MVLWSTHDDMELLYGDVLDVWRPWTTELGGGPIESGHHIAEDAPDDLIERLAPCLHGRSNTCVIGADHGAAP